MCACWLPPRWTLQCVDKGLISTVRRVWFQSHLLWGSEIHPTGLTGRLQEFPTRRSAHPEHSSWPADTLNRGVSLPPKERAALGPLTSLQLSPPSLWPCCLPGWGGLQWEGQSGGDRPQADASSPDHPAELWSRAEPSGPRVAGPAYALPASGGLVLD